MKTLDDAWGWYVAATGSMKRLAHLARYWGQLPWGEGVPSIEPLEKDNVLRHVEASGLSEDARVVGDELDDLAVILMFSAFEAVVRQVVAEQVEQESRGLEHPMLIAAAKDSIEAINKRSFAQVLAAYSKGGHADLAERVRQVRHYRNWLTHGRRKKPKAVVDARAAYDRLREFLALIRNDRPGSTRRAIT
jgi:hypothetical protein